MYIHLGESTVVNVRDVVAIIDLDHTTVSKSTRDFLTQAEKSGCVVNVSEELPKSAVICMMEGVMRVYISQISPATLQKRYQAGRF